MSEPALPMEIDPNEKYVRIKIGKKGKVEVEAFNFHGEGCKQATERVEARLGFVKKRTDKDDGGEAHQTVRSS